MELNDVKVTVIVPMYNVEHILDKALETLFAQTLEGVEYIFIDDCSSDNTLQCLKEKMPKKNGVAVKILHHENNKGVAVARNTGLDNATGEYIYYVDADDYIEPRTLEILYNEAKNSDADIVGCEWFLSFAQNERHMRQADVESGDGLFRKMSYGVMRWNLWLFMVRRSPYERDGLRFIEGMNMGEDMMIMMKLAMNAGRVSIIHQPLYHYIQTNTGSLTKNFNAYRYQVTANVNEVGRYIEQAGRPELEEVLMQLKLTLKLPLLITDKVDDYETWLNWFPESNGVVDGNMELPWRTRYIQRAAAKRRFWVLKLYYRFVIKLVYGIIFR